jgi:hypothetical protein
MITIHLTEVWSLLVTFVAGYVIGYQLSNRSHNRRITELAEARGVQPTDMIVAPRQWIHPNTAPICTTCPRGWYENRQMRWLTCRHGPFLARRPRRPRLEQRIRTASSFSVMNHPTRRARGYCRRLC